MEIKKFARSAAILSSSMLLLTACGNANETPAAGDSPATSEPVKVGYFPLAHTSSAFNAETNGHFEDNNLDVELVATEGGAQAIPLLVSGEIDIVYSNYTSALLAADRGLDVVLLAGNDIGENDHGIYVSEDSGFDSYADLEGKRIAVNNLQNIGTLAIYAHMEEAGLSYDSAELVEMPYPDMAASISRGSVDAGWQVEPFQVSATKAGLKKMDNLFTGPVADMPVAGWVTTSKYVEENPEVVEAFRASLAASMEELTNDPDLLEETILDFTRIDEETVSQMEPPSFDVNLPMEKLEQSAEMLDKYGITESTVNVSEMSVE